MVLYPVIAGFAMIIVCMVVHNGIWGGYMGGFPANRVIYALTSVIGTMLVHQGLDGIARYYNYKLGDDRFNFENESFEQSEEKNENEYSVNIPMVYYFKKKMHERDGSTLSIPSVPPSSLVLLDRVSLSASLTLSSGNTRRRALP